MLSKQNKIVLIIVIVLILAGLVYLIKNNQATQDISGQNVGKLRTIDATDHILGDLDAPVQMIIYSDFACPFCSQFADTVKTIRENFEDKIVITFRHYPLPGHAEAMTAAEASECAAEQGKFWEMYDKLFADNKAGRLGEEQFKQDAADLGLDVAKFSQCLDAGTYKDKIKQQKAEGEDAGVTGTPTSFVNNYIYPGAYPFEDFTASDGQQEKGMRSIISGMIQ